MKIEFQEEGHKYFLDGISVWSVTQILKAARIGKDFSGVPTSILEPATNLGLNVHATISLFSNNDLDEESLDPILALYLEQWKKLLIDKSIIVLEVEQIVASLKLLYAGRFDILCMLDNKRTILDLKTGMDDKETIAATGIQLAGYVKAYNEKRLVRDQAKQRVGIWLTQNSHKMIEYTDKSDFTVFTSALSVANHNLPFRKGE